MRAGGGGAGAREGGSTISRPFGLGSAAGAYRRRAWDGDSSLRLRYAARGAATQSEREEGVLWFQNAKGRLIFINRPFLFCCALRDSVTSRDPVRPCKAGLSRPSRKARRRLARGPQNTKGRLTFVNRPFLFWCPRRDSNPHTSRHMDLNHARLPIPPRGLRCKAKTVIIDGLRELSTGFLLQ